MKTKELLSALTAIFIFSLTACQKEVSVESGSNPAPTPVDSIYLSKLVILDIQGAIIDTSFIRTYQYDNLKRVTTVIEYSLSQGVTVFYDSLSYSYNSTDMVPFKVFEYATEPGQSRDTGITFLTYNSSSKLVGDSTISSSADLVSSTYTVRKYISAFSYPAGKIYRILSSSILYDITNSEEPFVQYDTASLDAANNILSCSQRTLIGAVGPTVETRISAFTYDNKPSPYLKQNVNGVFPRFPDGSDDLYNQQFCKNNRLKAHVETSGPFGGIYDEDFTGRYTYQLNGYPSSILIPDPAMPANFTKFLFTYRAL